MESEKSLCSDNRIHYNCSPEEIRDFSLGKITEEYGTEGIYTHLIDTLKVNDLTSNKLVMSCLDIGLATHWNDRRVKGKAIDHLMRVMIHVVKTLGVRDENIIAAAPIHDLLEDHPIFFEDFGQNTGPRNNYYKRVIGKNRLTQITNPEIAKIVESVSNPILENGQNKQKEYIEHCKLLIANSPKGRVVKLADFIDNACGNHETPGDKQRRNDVRYIELYSLHRDGLYLPDSLIIGETREKAAAILDAGKERALERMRFVGSETLRMS